MPDIRQVGRQYACGGKKCQKRRHRENCEEHRRQDPDHTRREERIRERVSAGAAAVGENPGPSTREMDWEAVRNVVGTDTMVVFRESQRAVREETREEVRTQIRSVLGRRTRRQGATDPPRLEE